MLGNQLTTGILAEIAVTLKEAALSVRRSFCEYYANR